MAAQGTAMQVEGRHDALRRRGRLRFMYLYRRPHLDLPRSASRSPLNLELHGDGYCAGWPSKPHL